MEDKLDNSDCGLRLFKKGYNEMEHFWHYFDVIYVKQYFQEKTGLGESWDMPQYCYITKHFVTLASRSNRLGKRTTEQRVHNLMIISLQPIKPLTISSEWETAIMKMKRMNDLVMKIIYVFLIILIEFVIRL